MNSGPDNEAWIDAELARIVELRKTVGAYPVLLGHAPDWFLDAMLAVEKLHGTFLEIDLNMELVDRFAAVLARLINQPFDRETVANVGMSKFGEGLTFVSEPYAIDADSLLAWERFASAAGVGLRVSPASWYWPGRSFRLELYQINTQKIAATGQAA